jgi:phosphatidylserine decarboxylase
MLQFFTNNLLWSEGWIVLLVTILVMAIGWYYFRPLFYIASAFLIFAFFFFRNPDRLCPNLVGIASHKVIAAPADGKIVEIIKPGGDAEGYAQRVSIFLSLFDAHVNWAPIAGTIKEVLYSPGEFTLAYQPKSSLLNERNDITIESSDGIRVKMRQIAGTVARRICCWVDPGDTIVQCEKVGMIRFGSRVDLFLPANAMVQVELGQQVYGGQSVIAIVQ